MVRAPIVPHSVWRAPAGHAGALRPNHRWAWVGSPTVDNDNAAGRLHDALEAYGGGAWQQQRSATDGLGNGVWT